MLQRRGAVGVKQTWGIHLQELHQLQEKRALRKNLIDPLILQGFVESAVPVPWPAECS